MTSTAPQATLDVRVMQLSAEIARTRDVLRRLDLIQKRVDLIATVNGESAAVGRRAS